MPTPSSNVTNQSDDSSLEPPIDLVISASNNDSDRSASQQVIHTPRRSMRQIHIPSKYKNFHVTYPSSTAVNHFTSTSLYPLSSTFPFIFGFCPYLYIFNCK